MGPKKLLKLRNTLKATLVPPPTTWIENFVSGASASFMSKLILQPFDTTKTILQGNVEVRRGYKNVFDCVIGISKARGVTSLYSGLLASVAVSAPSSAVFFSTYEFVKHSVENMSTLHNPAFNLRILHPLAPVAGAAIGNMFSSIVRVPPEVLKQRVQANIHSDLLQAAVTIWKQEGIKGFYTGYSSMVSRDIPYAAVQFTLFEVLKQRRKHLAEKRNGVELSQFECGLSNLWMGAVSGAAASIATAPLDVVKTRVMTQRVAPGGLYLGMRETFIKLWAEEGFTAFGRGLAPRLMYKVPSSAVFLVCYEGIKRLMRRARQTKSSLQVSVRD